MVANSSWRRQRLLILCYHGLSIKDEHEWRKLYVTPEFFRRRLETLACLGYNVLPLGEAVTLLRAGELPPKSVVITFDDGFYDFYKFGYPTLREFRFPATVYQTTYYSNYPFPIFNLVLSYLFWRAAGRPIDGAAYGFPELSALPARGVDHTGLVEAFHARGRKQGLTPEQFNGVAERLAAEVGIDYREIMRSRMLQLMTPGEIAQISSDGIDVQLHTHRHRTPVDKQLFSREISDNRRWLARVTGRLPNHFCYPSGHHRAEFLPWLEAEQVVTATTCNLGLATRTTHPLLLPRLLDSMHVTDVEFEAWLSGVAAIFPQR
jgi:hypothetical protein